MTVTGYVQGVLSITGTVTGGTTINFEGSADGTTFVAIVGTNVSTGSTATSTTATGLWSFPVAGLAQIRARISSWASPSSVTVTGYASVIGNGGSASSGGSGGDIANITTSVTPGTSAAHLGKAEDAAASSGDTGVFALGVRKDSSTDVTSANGDYSQISTNAAGSVKVQAEPSLKTSFLCCSGYFTPANSATDMFTFYGYSNTIVKILRVEIDYMAGSAPGGINSFFLNKNVITAGSAPTSGGTAVSAVGLGSASSSTSAPIYYWTSNPSMAGVTYTAGRLNTVATPPAWNGDASRVPPNSKHILFDHKIAGQAITLNNGNEGIAINNNSTTVVGTGKLLSVTVYWTEESST